ncbi:acyltransferase domain-containing protein [Streptomyces sp. M19]
MEADWADTAGLDAGYWYRNLRQTVEFEGAVRGLVDAGFGAFVEVSPHPVLTVPIEETTEDADVVTVGTLRRDEGGWDRFLRSAGELFVRGVEVDWAPVFAGAEPVELPTYPFQRQRYWLKPAASTAGDVTAAGLSRADHPLLGAALPLADAEGYLFTGRLSLRTHPWLADHAVGGTVLLPGTAFLELANQAAHQVGCDRLDELVLEAPLLLPASGGLRLQLWIGAPDPLGQRTLKLYSRERTPPRTRSGRGTRAACWPRAPRRWTR